jgi:hypothetical protein
MLLEVGELCVPLSSVLRVRGGRGVADGRLKAVVLEHGALRQPFSLKKTIPLSWNVTVLS